VGAALAAVATDGLTCLAAYFIVARIPRFEIDSVSMSLREQLLQAGFGKKLEAERQAKEQERRAKEQQRKEHEQQRKAKEQQRIAQVQAAEAAKAARAQALQQRRQEEADRKERWTQIKHLIEQHRLPKLETDDYFNFVSRGKVRRLSVDPSLRERIISGEVIIVRCEGKHDVVPRDIGERIREYDARAVINMQDSAGAANESPSEDDPYKDFVVPDDLKW
jgi:uncharacterized protein